MFSLILSAMSRWFPPESLWRDAAYMRVFWSSTLSVLGSAVTQMALPLTAVQWLHASATQMGILAAAQLIPFILSLPAGVWIDRSSKKRLAVVFNLFAALGLIGIPLSYLLGQLSMTVLYVAAAINSTNEAIGGSAGQVFLTQMVGRDRLVEANSKLFAASSAAMVIGPAFAAALVAWMGPPLAITIDALSFVIAAWLIGRIRFTEPAPLPSSESVWAQTRAGLQLVWQTPMLRALVVVVFGWITLNDSFRALYVLFANRDLHLDAGHIALINTLGAIGGLLGSSASHWLERRYGIRNTMVWGIVIAGVGYLFYGQPTADWAWVACWAGAALLVQDLGGSIYVVNYLSLRQAVTPDALLGRMVTTMRFLTILFAPLGTILIGHAADNFGLRPVLSGIGIACVLLGLLASRLLPSRAPSAKPAPASA